MALAIYKEQTNNNTTTTTMRKSVTLYYSVALLFTFWSSSIFSFAIPVSITGADRIIDNTCFDVIENEDNVFNNSKTKTNSAVIVEKEQFLNEILKPYYFNIAASGTVWQINVSRLDPIPQPSGFQIRYRLQLQCSAVNQNISNNAEIRFPAQDPTTFRLPISHPLIESFSFDSGNNEWVIDLQDAIFSGSSLEFDLIAESPNHITPDGTNFLLDATVTSDNSDPESASGSGSWIATANMGIAKYLQYGPDTDALLDIPVRYYLYPCDPSFSEGAKGHLYLSNYTIIDKLPVGTVYNNSSGVYDGGTHSVTWSDSGIIENRACDFEGPTDYWIEVTFPSTYFGAAAVPPVTETFNIVTFEGYPFGEAITPANRLFDTDTLLHGFTLPNPLGTHTKAGYTPYFGGKDITFEGDTATFFVTMRTSASSTIPYYFRIEDPLPCLDYTPTASSQYQSLEYHDGPCANPAFQPTGYIELALFTEYLTISDDATFIANSPTIPLQFEDTNGKLDSIDVPYSHSYFGALRYKIFWNDIQSKLDSGAGISRLIWDSKSIGVQVGLSPYNLRLAAGIYIHGTVAEDKPPTYPMQDQYRVRNYGYFFGEAGNQLDSFGRIQTDIIIYDKAPVLYLQNSVSASTGLVTLTAYSYGGNLASNDTVIMTDLLPVGYTFKNETQQFIRIGNGLWNYSSSSGSSNSTSYPHLDDIFVQNNIDVEVIDNYNNTGRQLVRASFLPPPTVEIWDDLEYLRFSFYVNEKPMLYSAINEAQVFLTNPTSAANLLCQAGINGSTTPAASSDPNDLDGDGVTVGDAYCRATKTISPSSTIVNIKSNKAVKGDALAGTNFKPFPAIGDIKATGGNAKFQINLINNGGIGLEDLVIYDVLPHIGDTGLSETQIGTPRGSNFNTTFVGIDATTVPTGAVVGYSTSTNACRIELTTGATPFPTGCVNDWTTVVPVPASSVKSLRFTFPAGDIMEFIPGEAISIEYEVSYPAGIIDGKVAWNTFAYAGTRMDDGSDILPSEPPKVGIATPQVDLSVDISVYPTTIAVGEPVTYTLKIDHDGSVSETGDYVLPASTAQNVTLLDDFLSQGLTIIPGTSLVTHDFSGLTGGVTFDELTGNIHIPEIGPEDSYTITYKAYSNTEQTATSTLEIMTIGIGNETDSTPGNGVLSEDDQDDATASWVMPAISIKTLVEDVAGSGNYIEADATDGLTGKYYEGQPINYRYIIENTGSTSLTSLSLTNNLTSYLCDENFGYLGIGDVLAVDCEWTYGFLDAGIPQVNDGTIVATYNYSGGSKEVTATDGAAIEIIDCESDLAVVSTSVSANCGYTTGTIDIAANGTAPFSYVWSDMLPDARWVFENSTVDVSGNGNHQNGGSNSILDYSYDAINGTTSALFDGDDYLRYSVDGAFMETTFSKMSFSIWLKPANLTGYKTILDEGSSSYGIGLQLNGNLIEAGVRNAFTQFDAGSLIFPNDGEWHHVAMIFDEGEFTIYLDGVAGTTTTATYTTVSTHSGNGGIGYQDGGSGLGTRSNTFYSGLVDDVRIAHGQSWTTNQIVDLARNDGDRTNLETGTYEVAVINGAVCSKDTVFTTAISNQLNLNSPGNVGADQTICAGSTPSLFTNIASATASNPIEYQWENSIDGSLWNTIAGASASTYQSSALSVTTYFRRGAKQTSCPQLEYSDTITVTVITNVLSPGGISGDEENCGSFNPFAITSTSPAVGGGSIEYQWQTSEDQIVWTDFTNAILEEFDPPTISVKTYYRRGAKSSVCSNWAYTNIITKTVVTNLLDAGQIEGDESNCGSYDPTAIGVITPPTGGLNGNITYQWQMQVGAGSWTNIPSAFFASYNPDVINQTTNYRRGTRRSPCSNLVYSNIVVKEVLPGNGPVINNYPTGNLCSNTDYTFETPIIADAIFNWNFGIYATPQTASGHGPHQVSFNPPQTGVSTNINVELTAFVDGCEYKDDVDLVVLTGIDTTSIVAVDPTSCINPNGSITINANYYSSANIEVSLDGGTAWEAPNQLAFTNLSGGAYDIRIRYVGQSCIYDFGNILLSDIILVNSEIKEDYDAECDGLTKSFSAATDPSIDSYDWNFGSGASPASASGAGPHTVNYSTFGNKSISLQIDQAGCIKAYNESFELISNVTNGGTIGSDQFMCDLTDPDAFTNIGSASGGSGGTIEYQWQSRILVDPTLWGNWVNIAGATNIVYDAPSLSEKTQFRRLAPRTNCTAGVPSNVLTATPSSEPNAVIDNFESVCPGQAFSDNVTLNDVNIQNASFTIYTAAQNGVVNIFEDGSFLYNPNSAYCGTDKFIYEVCNDAGTCCDTATVNIDLTDPAAPVLYNIPENEAIHCDEEIPAAPFVLALENCLSVELGLDEVSTQGNSACELHNYEITRVWTATDYCGLSASDSQTITVEDITAPGIYRVYTLANGTRMVAGFADHVSERWKHITLPITFATKPVIFTQIISEVDDSTATVQLKNISKSQFQIKLAEEEFLDRKHGRERVAWIAMESGTGTLSNPFEVGSLPVTSSNTSINFTQSFSSKPVIITSIQTSYQNDPVVGRFNSLNASGASVYLQEEQSADFETTHTIEGVGYAAFENEGNLALDTGESFGETGRLSISGNIWTEITLSHAYKNPIVIATISSKFDSEPAVVRVKDVTPDNFWVKIEEWEYQTSTHDTEEISYVVVEGSIPFDATVACDAVPNPLLLNEEIVTVDNCDLAINLEYSESPNTANCAPGNEIVRTWYVEDECGNSTTYTRTITVFDNVDPEFTVPADIEIRCYDDINDLNLTGDVTDESDNCAIGLEATYADIFNGAFSCDSSYTVIRAWSLNDNCGNIVTKTQNISVVLEGVQLSVKMMLQGALMNTSDGLMRDDLRKGGLIPLIEPYTQISSYFHVGGGDETIDPSVLNVTGSNAIVDWVFIEIRHSIVVDSILATRSALLQRDGDVVDVDGFSPVRFGNVRPGQYNIAIRHRNHLGAMTLFAKRLRNETPAFKFDFSKDTNSSSNSAMNAFDFDGDDYVYLCQNTNTSSYTILEHVDNLPDLGLDTLVTCGPCGVYKTVQDGSWNVSSTWENGNIPPILLAGVEVMINHDIVVDDFLQVGNGSLLWIESGELTITNQLEVIDNGIVYALDSDITMGTNLYLAPNLPNSPKMVMYGGQLNIGTNYENHGADVFLTNVCLMSGTGFINTGGYDSFKDTKVELLSGNLHMNVANAILSTENTKFKLHSGDFTNDGLFSGTENFIWLLNGDIRNNGVWTSTISNYCISGSLFGLYNNELPTSQDCSNINGPYSGFICGKVVDRLVKEHLISDPDLPNIGTWGSHALRKENSVNALWAGDFNSDRQSIFQGPSNDVSQLFITVITDPDNVNNLPNYIRHAYDAADMDLDGKIIFQGPNNERAKLLFNSILVNPSNINYLPNFIVLEQIPR